MGSEVAKQIQKAFIMPQIFIHNTKNNAISKAFSKKIKFDLVCFFVKPQNIKEILTQYANNLLLTTTTNTVFVSILAGINFDSLSELLPYKSSTKYIRYMPNFGILCNMGVGSLFCKNLYHKKEAFFTKCFSRSSKIIKVNNEYDIAPLTSAFGSGIAFCAYVIDEFTKAAEGFLPNNLKYCKNYYFDLFLSVCCIYTKNNIQPLDLINNITSKGGVTMAGLNELEKANIKQAITNTLQACVKRAEELENLIK